MQNMRWESRREFAKWSGSAAAAMAFSAVACRKADGQQQAQRTPPPETLKAAFLMDLVLETAPAVNLGGRTIVIVVFGRRSCTQ